MKKILTVAFWVLLSIQVSAAEEKKPAFGMETDLVQPFIPKVGIFTLNLTREFWSVGGNGGELMLGVFIRPKVKHDVVDVIDEYAVSIGVRQYIWQGLHVEAKYSAGYVWGKTNLVDRKDYESFVQLGEILVGYRFDVYAFGSSTLYIAPQFGVLQGLNPELIIGPRNGKSDTFLEGKLLVGLRF